MSWETIEQDHSLQFPKLLRKNVYSRNIKFLNNCNIAFGQIHSTVHTDKVAESICSTSHTACIFLDFSTALGCMVKKYLSKRSQFVAVNDYNLNIQPITYGTPKALFWALFCLSSMSMVFKSYLLFCSLCRIDKNMNSILCTQDNP